MQVGKTQLQGGIVGYSGGTTRVSTSSAGGESNGHSSGAIAISADGRYVAFESDATNLIAGDTNGNRDIFVKDTLSGTTTRVSTSSAGGQSNYSSFITDISADGRYVAFQSSASNLVDGDTNNNQDVFVKDILTGETIRVSTDSAGQEVNSLSSAAAISADGRYVMFDSIASNLVEGDSNNFRDAFVKDTLTGVTTRVSTNSAGEEGNSNSIARAISADGRYVIFDSDASNLVSGDTNGRPDVFVKDTITGITTRVTTDGTGAEAIGRSGFGVISGDGRYAAFTSDASNLVAGDTNGLRDAFVKDMLTGETIRVSTDSAGQEGNSGSSAPAISADGRYVAFSSSASNLVEGDTNGLLDAFIKDMFTGVTTRVSTDSAGGQHNGTSSPPYALSADGRYVAFWSNASNLVAGDTNGVPDVFLRDLTTTGVQQLAGLIVSNQASAGVTMMLTARARTELSEYRSAIGMVLNRIESFKSTLNSSITNNKEVAARILDADVAEETSKFMAARIRQEITVDLIRKLNLDGSLALKLLTG